WSSTHEVIARYLEFYPDLTSVLSILPQAQELLSAEKTPTLALALPVYELVIQALNDCTFKLPELCYAIEHGIDKISGCVAKARDLPVYVLAMAVNPSLKFEWIDENRDSFDQLQSCVTVKNVMLDICQKQPRRAKATALNPDTHAERATQAQAQG
ncbi:hypothetical protein FRC11_014137, partial [Ceratobasidium sp. 423]